MTTTYVARAGALGALLSLASLAVGAPALAAGPQSPTTGAADTSTHAPVAASSAPETRSAQPVAARRTSSTTIGDHVVKGRIGAAYLAAGGTKSTLGTPTSEEYTIQDGIIAQNFSEGRMYYTPRTGAHGVRDHLYPTYRVLGRSTSVLGLPTSGQITTSYGILQRFEHGSMTWNRSSDRVTVRDANGTVLRRGTSDGTRTSTGSTSSSSASSGTSKSSAAKSSAAKPKRAITEESSTSRSSTRATQKSTTSAKKSTSSTKKSTSAKKSTSSASSGSSTGSSVWDRLAQCESSGNWSINSGNGFYGGLQFTLSTWRAYGGSGMPNQASRAEQIRVAQKVQAGQGWGAWPACSSKLGLR